MICEINDIALYPLNVGSTGRSARPSVFCQISEQTFTPVAAPRQALSHFGIHLEISSNLRDHGQISVVPVVDLTTHIGFALKTGGEHT